MVGFGRIWLTARPPAHVLAARIMHNRFFGGGRTRQQEELRYVADLEKDGDKVLLASGGKPGLGNLHVASRRVGTVSSAIGATLTR